jgi:uncharacterized protein YqjF (DUF2071 family)
MGQTWEDLLFAHWRVPVNSLRRVVPSQLPLDSFDGDAWIGVTPFLVRGLHPRLTPPLPFVSRFAELNVRTYVTLGGRPGIYFLSLDAASWLAVLGARRLYRLPYFRARMAIRRHRGEVAYASRRMSFDGEPAAFHGTYRPTGPPFEPAAGSLEYFLTERYCLYTLDERQRVHRADIHHPPWPVQAAAAEISHNSMGAPLGLALEEEPLLHFARRQDVLIWPLSRVEDSGSRPVSRTAPA